MNRSSLNAIPANITVVTDRRILANHVRSLLSSIGLITICEAGTVQHSDAAMQSECAELFILDQSAWVDGDVRAATSRAPYSTVFWCPSAAPEIELTALEYGARGLLSDYSGDDEVIECAQTVLSGGMWLPRDLAPFMLGGRLRKLCPREAQVVRLVTQGLTNKEIALALSLTEGTVKVYLSRIFDKLCVSDRFELALVGLRSYGLIWGNMSNSVQIATLMGGRVASPPVTNMLVPDTTWRPNVPDIGYTRPVKFIPALNQSPAAAIGRVQK